MKKLFAILLSTASVLTANAQFFNAKDYDYGDPVYDNVQADDSTDIYLLLNKHLMNYYYDKDNSLKEEYLLHKKIYVNSSDAIEGLNKIYISQGSDEDALINFKARVINPDGQTREITEDKILTGVDEDDDRKYTYFALEGLQVGSQVEYFYVKKIDPRVNGVYFDVQGYYPVKRAELDVITPWNLVMASKTYNLDADFKTDTSLDGQNRIYLHIDSLAPLKKEETAFRDANLGRAVYKLDENRYNGKKNIVAYSYIAQNVVNNTNRELSKREEKALAKMEKEISKFEPENQVSDIRRIENYLKTNYQYLNQGNPVLSEIDGIYKNKAFNELGAVVLYSHLLKDKNIDYRIVYTSDRSELPFDPNFECNIYLNDLLFYFPEEKDLLDFSDPFSRMGYISALNTGCQGLFIEEMELNDNTVGVATTEFIPAKPASFTTDSLEVKVNFADDLYDNSLNVHRVITGYDARFYQPIFNFIKDEDQKKNLQESLLKYIDSDAKVEGLEIKNAEGNLLGIKPLVADGRLESANFVEKAGNNFLLKIGKLIGPQSEMYEEKAERVMDVQSNYARTYFRTLTFTIPEGYEVSGLEALNVDEKLMYKDTASCRFVSTYTQEGRTVKVKIFEYYNEVEYPKSLFEDYRKVINAAADFNKKTLLLKKV